MQTLLPTGINKVQFLIIKFLTKLFSPKKLKTSEFVLNIVYQKCVNVVIFTNSKKHKKPCENMPYNTVHDPKLSHF